MTGDGRGLSRVWRVALSLSWVLASLLVIAWVTRTPTMTLRNQLVTYQFWSLEICVVILLASSIVALREMREYLRREDAINLAAVAIVAAGLVLFVAPRTNRIYYDEQIYQSIGHNMADMRRAQMCLDGNVEYGRLSCAAGEYNKQPYAYPHLLSLVYRIGGAHQAWAFIVNAAAMAISVCAVYLLVLIGFQDRTAALFASLLLALTPQQLLWSATAAVEPLASMACVIAVLAAAHFTRSRTTAALLAAGVATVYALQFRPESLLIVFVIGLLLWHMAGDQLRTQRLWWVGLLCLALVAVHVAHLYSVRNEGWGTTDARLSLRYVGPNFRVNGGFYVGDGRFPVVYTGLAVLGLLAAGQGVLRQTMVLYFSVFFGIGLLFYAGSYNYGADVRYSLMTYPPLAILGGRGAAYLVEWLGQRRSPFSPRAIVMAALAFQFLWYAPLVRATTEEAWAARADVRFAETFAPALPPNSYVLTHNPGIFHLAGVNAGQMSMIVQQPTRLKFLQERYAGGVYLHWNFWCNVTDPVQQAICRAALDMGPAIAVHEYRERDQRFAVYRFSPIGLLPDPANSSSASR